MSKNFSLDNLLLILVTFVTGAAIMVVELAGNKILAPMFGNTMLTWTALIGIILISMGLGSYIGGKIVDKWPSYFILGVMLSVSGFFVLLIPTLSASLNTLTHGYGPLRHIIWGPVFYCLVLFWLPGIILGGVTPFVIRMDSLMSLDKHIGLSAGNIQCSSTLGSVVGTFLTGFVLIPSWGLFKIYGMMGLILVCLSILAFIKNYKNKATSQAFLFIPLLSVVIPATIFTFRPNQKDSNLIYEKNSFYHKISVFQNTLGSKKSLQLKIDNLIHDVWLDEFDKGPINYLKYWKLAEIFNPDLNLCAFLGGGGFAMPIAFMSHYPHMKADVVEIDPELIRVAYKYFKVDAKNLKIVAADARHFLANTSNRYDFIFGDAYKSIYIPSHLTTVEFFQLVKSKLTSNGLFMLNILSSIDGKHTKLLKSVIKTLRTSFKNIYIFGNNFKAPRTTQNIILVATAKNLPLHDLSFRNTFKDAGVQRLLETYISSDNEFDYSGGLLLTDEYNPIEYMAAKPLMQLTFKLW
ncbi:MAG: fused MFS/spermidine synthase [Bacteriovoracaceae bacterium]|nr:fused MFS/spermidine synthase [Bacteriovoracaceae bacterium]